MDYLNFKPDKEGSIKVDGGEIYYRVNYSKSTAKKPPLLGVHGGPGMSHHYLLPLLELSAERDIILYDQLDAGLSRWKNDKAFWTLSHFTSEIDSIRKELDLTELSIFGSSWGCSIVVNYAATRPKGLKSLILSGALVNTKRWIADNDEYRKALPQDIQDILTRYEKTQEYDNRDYLKAVDVFYSKHLCRLDEWPDYLIESLEKFNLEQYNHMWGPTEFVCTGTLKDLNLEPLLASIQEPTLFISGEYDEGTPESSAYYAALMSNAQTFTVKEASHTPHIEKPQEFTKAVTEFLR